MAISIICVYSCLHQKQLSGGVQYNQLITFSVAASVQCIQNLQNRSPGGSLEIQNYSTDNSYPEKFRRLRRCHCKTGKTF